MSTPQVVVGHLYDVSLKGEPEFGGRVRVLSVSTSAITARFEIDGWIDDDILHFKRDGRYDLDFDKHSAFVTRSSPACTFRRCK